MKQFPATTIAIPALTLFCAVYSVGCSTVEGFQEDIIDLLGTEQNEQKENALSKFSEILNYQKEARNKTEAAYADYLALIDEQNDELESHYAEFSKAVNDLRTEASFLTNSLKEADEAIVGFIEDINEEVEEKIDNPVLQEAARRELDKLRQEYLSVFDMAAEYEVDINPLVNLFEGQIDTLKDEVSDATIGQVRTQSDKIKAEVDGVLNQIEQQHQTLEEMIEQIDVVERALSAMNLG